jgi:hypothetical protein
MRDTKTTIEVYEFTVGAQFIGAIYYGDFTGLTDNEENQLNDFLKGYETDNTHWEVPEDDGFEFARCEVSGQFGDCITLNLVRVGNTEESPR